MGQYIKKEQDLLEVFFSMGVAWVGVGESLETKHKVMLTHDYRTKLQL